MGRLFLLLALAVAATLHAGTPETPAVPSHRIAPDDPAWVDLLKQAAQRPDVRAEFEEHRWFSFRKTPTVLTGEARVSSTHGLSLHYHEPEERIVIMDARGLVVRERGRDSIPPSDPRAAAANTAMLHLLRMDLHALTDAFELFGDRTGPSWIVALLPRSAALRRTLGQISASGENANVTRIELRRSLTQRVEIAIAPPGPSTPFTEDELRRFFR